MRLCIRYATKVTYVCVYILLLLHYIFIGHFLFDGVLNFCIQVLSIKALQQHVKDKTVAGALESVKTFYIKQYASLHSGM